MMELLWRKQGEIIKSTDLEVLRPCPNDAISPSDFSNVIGKTLLKDLNAGEYLRWKNIK